MSCVLTLNSKHMGSDYNAHRLHHRHVIKVRRIIGGSHSTHLHHRCHTPLVQQQEKTCFMFIICFRFQYMPSQYHKSKSHGPFQTFTIVFQNNNKFKSKKQTCVFVSVFCDNTPTTICLIIGRPVPSGLQ